MKTGKQKNKKEEGVQLEFFKEISQQVDVIHKTKRTTLENKVKEFNLLLDSTPPKSWIKINPLFKNKYIPIRIVESLLKSIFGYYQIKKAGEIMIVSASIIYPIDLIVYHPILKDWL